MFEVLNTPVAKYPHQYQYSYTVHSYLSDGSTGLVCKII